MRNLNSFSFYPRISEEYVLIAYPSLKTFILYNWRRDKEFLINESTFKLLSLCDGVHTLKDILNLCENPDVALNFIEYFLSKNLITLKEFPLKIDKKQIRCHTGRPLKNVTWYITGRCNLQCLHCFIGGSKYKNVELSYSKILKILRDISRANVLSIGITGGEPFIRSDILKILKKVADYSINIRSIFTNGLLINQVIIDQIKKLDMDITFCISLDGIDEKHDVLRGKAGSFRRTLSNIKLLRKNDIPVAINTCITKLNIGQIKYLYHLLKNLEVSRWRLSAPFEIGLWKTAPKELKISIEEEIQVCREILDLWKQDGEPFILQLDHVFHSENKYEEYTAESYLCEYAIENCAIMPNGDVVPCDALYEAGVVVGNLLNDSLINLWESDKMKNFKCLKVKDLLVLTHNKRCIDCEFLIYCGLGCRLNAYIEKGNIYYYDPYMCEVIKKIKGHITRS